MAGQPSQMIDINKENSRAKYALRSFSEVGQPTEIYFYYQKMYYVYLLRSLKNPSKTYIGYTININQRLETHNSGGSIYTKDDRPWEMVMYLAFKSEPKALDFEKYIKIGSGHAFAKKRFW